MRIFNTIQELWQFCLYCPICQQPSRTLKLSVGPDDYFKLSEYEKTDTNLQLVCGYRHDRVTRANHSKLINYTAVFNINCLKNTYNIGVAGKDNRILERIKSSYFFFYIDANCMLCNNTYLNTADLELNAFDKTVSTIQMDRESAYLVSEKDKYHITLCHDLNTTHVSRITLGMDGSIIDDENVIELPLLDIDFAQPLKTTSKIKTLILFS